MENRNSTQTRALLKEAFLAGVAAADPAQAVRRALADEPLERGGQWHIIALGKAAPAMAQAALEIIPSAPALVVTNHENAGPVSGAVVYAAGHPVPDEPGLLAGQAVLAKLDKLGVSDRLLALISGGASALVPTPAPGLTLADKMAVHAQLLVSGLDITAMNLVRQNLSELKGGGLLRHAEPASVRSLILSDVLGDDLRAIGSGPSVGPIGSASDARALLQDAGLWPDLPQAVKDVLSQDVTQAPLPPSTATLIGSNRLSLSAMAEAAGAKISPADLVGDVADAAAQIVAEAQTLRPGTALAFGGETTVKLTGEGLGGRNQELALRVASEAAAQGLDGPWWFLSGGTDGRDGPTDAAGGLVDHKTLDRLSSAGQRIEDVLADNASYNALKATDDLLVTGPTGTNVADLQLFLRGPYPG
ncbi:MAG: DUF4147 domain-containing protein [Pseudomonadota bacterium]